MTDKKCIVIHPDDRTTDFLCPVYGTLSAGRITQSKSNSYILDAIQSADVVIMLGHGDPSGLFGGSGGRSHYVVNSKMVQALRKKICIGIWCNADSFAMKYGLHGLFSGMVISDIGEAAENGIKTDYDELSVENDRLAFLLKKGLQTVPLSGMPAFMAGNGGDDTPLKKFNYSSFYYFQ